MWKDAPSHICRGGDLRGLAFCCPPIKNCPIHDALEVLKMTPEEYIKIKEEFGKKTRLGEGKGTCFNSLVWCCKISKPCPLRDMVLRSIGMSKEEYMELKKKLSQEILRRSRFFREAVELLEEKGFKREDVEKLLLETGDLRKTILKLKSSN
ncbi:methanogenesis marker 9 domain-containing protein [Methanofervidicoccus sp. A16]|uniref:methanogenesis marker 9 domain-containing protein n=1 Tax=Methanofervidicoccus sp. A16 TaxID=2607662 RepID=UPI0011879B27|nr:methanogenesis marker 9 domain-containing protein [Methanofervidicoccus sp. A16]AXI24772.1 methanogenesis marker 9 domain-containing protein [Methanofervidicoccus sp. A16]